MDGYTIVLIDSKDGSEGDFVHVEAFDNLGELMEIEEGATYPGWVDRVCQAAHQIEEREV